MTRYISAEAKSIEETCNIKLRHVVNLDEDGIREEVYDITSPQSNLMLVVMHHGSEQPRFIVAYGTTQIPCPGIHTSEEIEDILNLQREFPVPISSLTHEVMHNTIFHSQSFISEFMSRLESEVDGRRD